MKSLYFCTLLQEMSKNFTKFNHTGLLVTILTTTLEVNRFMKVEEVSNQKYGLQLMSDDYILENLIEELREP